MPPPETDSDKNWEIASPKQLRLNVDLELKPLPCHWDSTLAPFN